jgi:hypothetical protein
LRSAEELLMALRKRLDGPVAPELKRRIVETLVESIQANTVEKWGVQQSELVISLWLVTGSARASPASGYSAKAPGTLI